MSYLWLKKIWRSIALCWFFFLIFTGCGNQQLSVEDFPLDGEQLSLNWSFDSGGAINHPIVVADDNVLFVPHNGTLIAIDAASGILRWEYEAPAKVWERAYASDGERIFVGLEGGKLVGLDVRSGEVMWETNLGINVQVPPLVVDDLLYVSTTFVGPGLIFDPEKKVKLFVLRASDGLELWSFQTDNYILQTPYIYGDRVYLAGTFYSPVEIDEGGHTRIYALSTVDGSEQWQFESEDGFPKQIYATPSSIVFLGYQDYINGLDSQNGELIWRKDTGNWVPTFYGIDTVIYFGSANTAVYALDANSGESIWNFNIPEGTFNYLMGAPVRVRDDLYFITQHGDIMALNALDGGLLWTISTGVTPRTGLTVEHGWLFFGDINGMVYGYGARDG